jgi:S1-C subfamily serine protease
MHGEDWRDLLAGALLGLLVGLLIGLAASSGIVAAVIAGLVALLGAFFGLGGGASSVKLLSEWHPLRFIGFALCAAIATPAAIVVRTHDMLSPPLARQLAELRDAGLKDEEARAVALYTRYGLAPKDWTASQRPATGASALFAGDAATCEQLRGDRLANAEERAGAFKRRRRLGRDRRVRPRGDPRGGVEARLHEAMRALAAALALSLALSAAAPAQGVVGEVLTRVSESVLRVEARGCDGRDRAGSGFVWSASDRVVTALHVVVGCQRVWVRHERRGIERDAQIVAVLRDSDLALLKVDRAGDLPALAHEIRLPQLQDDLAVLGYELGLPTMGSKNLKLSFGQSRLRDMITDPVRQELQLLGFPSIELQVLRLEGHLLPGHSGAPIIDRHGRVVAIASGGLERGAAAISWGLPAGQLERLAASSERAPTGTGGRVSSLFALSAEAAEPGAARAAVRCGTVEFTKMRTRRLDEIARTTDDVVGLQQLLQGFAAFGLAEIGAQRFDIHVDRDSGGTIVLPADIPLRGSDGLCTAQSARGTVRIFVRGDVVASATEMQAASVNFENAVSQQLPLIFRVDPNWSYPVARQRFDGLAFTRKAFVGYDRMLGVERAYGFETLIGRGRALIGIAGINLELQPSAAAQAVNFCQFQPAAPVCGQLRQIVTDWAPFVLSIFLSTFPIG